MARGPKRSKEEILRSELTKVSEELEKIKAKEKELAKKQKDLENELKAIEMDGLLSLIAEKGLSADELRNLIESNEGSDEAAATNEGEY